MRGGERLILASGSPRRAALLRQVGFKFDILPSSVEEDVDGFKSPIQCVLVLSRRKTDDVAKKVKEGIIVGADTLVVLDGKYFGKPRDESEAKKMLRQLSGREHLVYTGFTLLHKPSGLRRSEFEVTRVKFRELFPDEIEAYVKSGSCFDKAGAYGIQDDYGAVFVERIDGCYYNVVGFPLAKFYVTWRKFKQSITNEKKDSCAHRKGRS